MAFISQVRAILSFSRLAQVALKKFSKKKRSRKVLPKVKRKGNKSRLL